MVSEFQNGVMAACLIKQNRNVGGGVYIFFGTFAISLDIFLYTPRKHRVKSPI
jgi:hypothetical protein